MCGARKIILGIAPLTFGFASIWLGQDANWDLKNYHWYNPYALLHWRFHKDIAPANVQNFLSPLFDVPWYLMAQVLPAKAVGFAIGAVHSANLILVYLLSIKLLPMRAGMAREVVALGVAVFAVLGPGVTQLIGTTFNDLIVSIGVLASLLLALRAIEATETPRMLSMAFVAGIPIGVALAGKLTSAPFAVALVVAFLAVSQSTTRRLQLSLAFGIGAAVAFVLLGGPWFVWLWLEYGNPVFPFFNNVFNSPFTTMGAEYEPNRPQPRGILQWMFFPFYFSGNATSVTSVPMVDYRFAAANVILPVLLILSFFSGGRPLANGARYLLAVMLVAYIIWMARFGWYRYALAIHMLIPLSIAVVVLNWLGPRRDVVASFFILMVVLTISSRGEDWSRAPWTERFVELAPGEVLNFTDPAKTLVVLLDSPLAFLVTLMPKEVSAIQIDTQIAPLEPIDHPWNVRIRSRLSQSWSEIYGISSGGRWTPDLKRRLQSYRLSADLPTCRILRTNITVNDWLDDKPVFCKLLRTNGDFADWPLPIDLSSRSTRPF